MLVHQEIYIFELEQSFELVWVASVFHSNPYIKIWMPLKTSKKWHQLLPLASAVQPVHTFIFVHHVKLPASKFCWALVNGQLDIQPSDWWTGEVPFYRKFYLVKVLSFLSVQRSRLNTQRGKWDLVTMPEEKDLGIRTKMSYGKDLINVCNIL